MHVVRKIFLLIFGLLVIIALALGLFAYHLSPDYEGEQALTGLQEDVPVYFDTYGIPHIYGANESDAFRTLGYVHAQDRLWQMELLRRIGNGGLSEVFGEDMVGTDKFFLAMGIDDASKDAVAKLDKSAPAVMLAQAYLDGINQFIAEGPTPVEFYLTGTAKTPFTIKDIYNTMGYMAFSFAMAHKTDPLLTNIKETLGAPYLKDLSIDPADDTELIPNYPKKTATAQMEGDALTTSIGKALSAIQLPLFEGSNSWVLAPAKTKNGKVIFANDPHIGFAQPSVWYEAHLETPEYTKYGYHLAGVPFPILAHDRNLAYGMTMFENDDVDFYYEKVAADKPDQYYWEGDWKPFDTLTKTIKVKDAADITFTYRTSVHGPILNGIADQITGERPIAMSWIYPQGNNQILEALYEMSHAKDLKALKLALLKVHAPGLNIMYGDAAGNIAWFATAQLYAIPDSINTKIIYAPGEGLPLEKEMLDFKENPQAINPPSNFVYSANNQPDSVLGRRYPGYYLPENRAKRIVELLRPKDDWDKASVADMLLDVTSSVDADIALELSKMVPLDDLDDTELLVLDTLATWKGDYPLTSVAATVYTRWVYNFLEATFSDELGPENFAAFLGTHFHKRLIAPMSKKEVSVWWDDITTEGVKEGRQDIVKRSFLKTVESLKADLGKDVEQWQWERLHTLEHPHPIGQVAALRPYFNVGPFPIHGSREVINNMAFTYNGDGEYATSAGPSTRRVVDFSDVEASISILPTGQSGNPFSKHYADQAELYNKGGFRPMLMNKEAIQNESEILIFRKNDE